MGATRRATLRSAWRPLRNKRSYHSFDSKIPAHCLVRLQIHELHYKNFCWHHDDCGAIKDKAYGIVSLPDDGLIVVGNSRSQQSLEYNAWILRLSRDGKLIWERSFGGSRSDQLYAVASTPDGGVAVAGHTRSKGAGKSDVWILRLNLDGELLWERTFGGLAVAGYTTSAGAGYEDFWVFRVDARGRF